MIKGKRNLFKVKNAFKCQHDVHQHFQAQMSPFHILEQKSCYPHGCVTFDWKCKLLAKRKKCFRGFSHVGKECFNCRYFVEEKIHQYPKYDNEYKSFESFISEYNEFKEWIEELKRERILVEGNIYSVKPDFMLYRNNSKWRLSFRGFLIRFDEGFINNTLFEDPFYLHISGDQQNHLLLRERDNVEFSANMIIEKGRIEFIKASRFQFLERGETKALKRNDIVVATTSYTIQSGQPQKCLNCRNGILSDIGRTDSGPSRAIVCTQGVNDYNDCILHEPERKDEDGDSCANNISCHQAL